MRRLVPVLLAIGCNHDVERDAVATPSRATVLAPVAPAVRGAPHAGSIREVSVTDAGDAALTIDDAGTLRLWPALDGTREPIPVVVPAAARAALVRDGDGLLAALLDGAGSAHLLRFARGGLLVGKAEVAGDVRIEQVVGSGGGMLVRRADQSIELVDARGEIAGRVVADPGERIAAVAARGEVALAVIADGDGTAKTVRWIARGSGLAWGARVTLPATVIADSVAIAPSGKRLAAAEATSRQLFVFDLAVKPALVIGTSVQVMANEPVGFIDDAHAVVMGTQPRWWSAASEPTSDPWAATTPVNPATSVGAVGGSMLVSGYGGGLALATPARTRYLGWQDIGAQTAAFQDGRIVVTFGPSRVAWLDDALVEQRRAELTGTATHVQPLDEHHAAYAWQVSDEQHVELADLDHADRPVPLGSFKTITRFDYEPRTHVLGVGEGTVEHRWALDVAKNAARKLPDLVVPGDASYVRLLDPATANGAEAIAASASAEVTLLPGGTPKKLPGYLLSVDDAGHVYTRDDKNASYRDGTLVTMRSVDLPVPDHAGTLVASIGPGGVELLDGNVTRWNLPLWGVYGAAFSDDDTKLLVRAMGGLVMVDVGSGERAATACGWSFGLFDKATATASVGQGSVCEDSER